MNPKIETVERSSHPMYREIRPAIMTGPINRLANTLSLALERGDRGIVVKGMGRVGKTWAVGCLARDVRWRPYPMSFFEMDFGSPDRPTETYFFGTVLMAAHLKHVRHADGIDNMSRACNYLIEQCKASKEKIIALVINEANRMSMRDYDHLVSLDNQLERGGKRLFAILVHQSDAEFGGPQTMDASPPSQLVGRFLSMEHEFTGLLWGDPTSANGGGDQCDVTRGFHEYDVGIIHPPTDGAPCTQFFAPRAYAAKWRLTSQVDDLIRPEIVSLRAQHGLSALAPWPMQTFERFVYFVLVRVAGEDPNFTSLSEEQVRHALKWSGYIELELSMHPGGNGLVNQ